MTFNSNKYHRRSIRLKGFNYSSPGAYFITICTQNREYLFGEIVNGKMILNDAGQMVQTVWDEIPSYYTGIDVDAYVVMPNHIHGIIIIVGATPCGCPETGPHAYPETGPHVCHEIDPHACPEIDPRVYPETGPRVYPEIGPRACPEIGPCVYPEIGQPRGVAPTMTLPDIVHRYKTMTTKRYADGVKQNGWPPFPGKLWQRNYYEHIIRNQNELKRIREYIINNPLNWITDEMKQVPVSILK